MLLLYQVVACHKGDKSEEDAGEEIGCYQTIVAFLQHADILAHECGEGSEASTESRDEDEAHGWGQPPPVEVEGGKESDQKTTYNIHCQCTHRCRLPYEYLHKLGDAIA